MAFTHSKSTRVIINEKKLSADIHSVSMSHEREASEVTSLEDSGGRYIPGLASGSITLGARFDSAAGAFHDHFSNEIGIDNGVLLSVFPAGDTIGNPAFLAVADVSSYELESSVGDPVGIQAEAQGDDGVDWGVCQHILEAETVTGNETSVDNAASSTNGGVAILHVTAASGTSPSLTSKIQHSTDNSTWVDLITFTAATAVTSERKTVSGTVNRYTRETHTISGTGPSFTYAASFARR